MDEWPLRVITRLLTIITMTTCVAHLTSTAAAASTATATNTKELTCYTCTNRTTNYQCNKVAIDMPCDQGLGICYTEHHIDSGTNLTTYVIKSCVNSCPTRTIGCTQWSPRSDDVTAAPQKQQPNLMKCVSCCAESYCNKPAPANHSHARHLSSSVILMNSATNTNLNQNPWSILTVSMLSTLAILVLLDIHDELWNLSSCRASSLHTH